MSSSPRRALVVTSLAAALLAAGSALAGPALAGPAPAGPALARSTPAPSAPAIASGPLASEVLMTFAPAPAAGSALLSLDEANGQRTFGVQPANAKKVDARPNLTYRDVKPGQRIEDHVAILNVSKNPVTLDFYAADGFNTTSGGYDLKGQKEKSDDLGSWVKLTRTRATVPGRSALITPIEIRVPKNAEPGDHAAGVIASLRTGRTTQDGSVVAFDQRVGTRMYLRVAGKLAPSVTVTPVGAKYGSWLAPLRGSADVTYTVTNTGNVRLVGDETVRVSNLFGGSARAAVPALPELLPGSSATFTTHVDGVLPTFLNTAHVTVDPRSVSGNVDPAMAQASGSARFWTVSWPVVLVLLLAAGYGARLWWRRRRRPSGAGPTAWGQGTEPGPGPDPTTGDAAPSSPELVRRTVLDRSVPDRSVLDRSVPDRSVPGRGPGRRTGARRRALAVLAALVPVLVGGLALPTSAQAAGGTLTFIPGKGQDVTPLWAVTSGGCPARTEAVSGSVYGKGLPAEGAGFFSNSPAEGRKDGSFGIPPNNTFSAVAQQYGTKLSGPYRVVLRCSDTLVTKVYAEFTGTVTFGSPNSFTAPVPKQVPSAGGVPVQYLALAFPAYKKVVAADAKTAAAEQAADSAAATAKPSSAAAAAAPAANQAQPGAAASTFQAGGIGFFLVVLAGIAGVGAVGFLVTRPRKAGAAGGPGPKTAEAQVEWPDDEPAESGRR